ncbi:conserved hypothetical protein [Ixodes scapularis]|uniref:Phospholipase B-like n=1 Tax=Ixodes scapularis TaxID=6945 RepID=B7QEB0_IXOSC|nr:conserved hypothetical protein [Ixodes scapularis]|eukprot:XP_002413874.1 conserved hypothetical protein [Ixodes scapularis]
MAAVVGATTKYSKCQYAWASVRKSGDNLQIHDGKPGPGAVAWGSFESEIHFSGYENNDLTKIGVHLQMKQLSGLSDIFENKTLNVSNEYLNVTKALYFNLDGDLIGLVGVVSKNSYNSIDRAPTCSALIKVVGENEDILVGHNTWFVYRSMLRIEKRYAFPWHYTSKSITETSLENADGSLWNLVKPDSAPLTWVRGMVATRLATNGSQWVSIFGRLNSGTYNNQWMVLDYKLFTSGKAIAKNTLWILEQMPNLTKSEDLSNYLQKQRYWASYNVAYNNYTHDPVSRCNCTQKYNPVSAISARFDLLSPSLSTGLPGVKQKAVGGTDMKLTNYAMFKKLEFVAINGPTYTTDGSVPPFQWSTSGFKHQEHDGHPDKWTFGPTHHHWDTCPIH